MNVQETMLRNVAAEDIKEPFLIDRSSFLPRTALVAAAAATEAEEVDRDARFPQKAFDAARQQRLLGVQILLSSAETAPRSRTLPRCATRSVAPVPLRQ